MTKAALKEFAKSFFLFIFPVLFLGLLGQGTAWAADEIAGTLTLEGRLYQGAGSQGQTERWTRSLAVEPEYHKTWNNDRQSLRIQGFVRADSEDPSRTHADLREMLFVKAEGSWEFAFGVGIIYWGVTESQHLVDVINQTDFVENLDGEDKLGQPLVRYSMFGTWGDLHLFALPLFRPRTFPSERGRFRPSLALSTDQAIYESSEGVHHFDWAARWERSFGAMDFGLSHLAGTSREPFFQLSINPGSAPTLVPVYLLMVQTGLDFQWTIPSLLIKYEGIHRDYNDPVAEDFSAHTAGFEYSFYNLARVGDLGIVAEYLWHNAQTAVTSLFDKSIFAGLRFALNDTQSTSVLIGTILSTKTQDRSARLEFSRRMGSNLSLAIEGSLFSPDPATAGAFISKNDSFLETELSIFF